MSDDELCIQIIDDAFNTVIKLRDDKTFITKDELYSILLLMLHACCDEKDIFKAIKFK